MIFLLKGLIVFACLIIIASVMLQPAKGGGATALGGSSQSVFGSSGGTTFLFRLTMWAAAFVMATSLFIAWHKIHESHKSVIDLMPTAPIPSGPAAPAAPASPGTATTPPAGNDTHK